MSKNLKVANRQLKVGKAKDVSNVVAPVHNQDALMAIISQCEKQHISTGLTTKLGRLTAHDVEKLLPYNTRNRPISPAHVKKLLNQMINGEWSWTSPINIYLDSNHCIHNGQHSMTALLKAQKLYDSTPAYKDLFDKQGFNGQLYFENVNFIHGILPEHADLIDTGKPRSLSDSTFRLHLFDNKEYSISVQKSLASTTSTVCRFAYMRLYLGQRQRFAALFSIPAMFGFVRDYPSIKQSVIAIYEIQSCLEKQEGDKKTLKDYASIPQWVLLHFLSTTKLAGASSYDIDCADLALTFFKIIQEGSYKKGDTISTLLSYLGSIPTKNRGNQVLEGIFDSMVYAMNCYTQMEDIELSDLKRPTAIQDTTEEGLPIFRTSEGLLGWLDSANTYWYYSANEVLLSMSEAIRKTQGITLIPDTVPYMDRLSYGVELCMESGEDMEDLETEDPSENIEETEE